MFYFQRSVYNVKKHQKPLNIFLYTQTSGTDMLDDIFMKIKEEIQLLSMK